MHRTMAVTLLSISASLATAPAFAESPAAAPEWFAKHMAFMTRGSGRWITNNKSFKSDNEPFDAYGMEWKYGLGKKSLTGRLFAIREGKEVGTVWQFRMFWDPGKREVRAMQFGSDGTFGVGAVTSTISGTTRSEQRFFSPDGSSSILGHETAEKSGQHVTQSYDVASDGTWTRRRLYIWKLEP